MWQILISYQQWRQWKMEKNKEYILCAAIHYDDGIVYRNINYKKLGIKTGFVLCGHRHGDIISMLPTNSSYIGPEKAFPLAKKEIGMFEDIQGFLTSLGRFVDREEAAKLAIACNKCTPYFEKRLYSEDLY